MSIQQIFEKLPRQWDGREAVTKLQQADYNWRQMEWIGFYFQLLVRDAGKTFGFKMPGRRLVSGDFDAFYEGHDWDLKAHSLFNASGSPQSMSILNDTATIDLALMEKGVIFIAVAEGTPTYDHAGDFYRWHESLKGEPSNYVKQGRIEGRSKRVRKSAFTLDQVNIYKISEVSGLGIMNQGRNSNGRPRPSKYTLDSKKLQPIMVIKPTS